MALPSKIDELPFSGGVHENEDQWVQSQGFLRMVNCVEEKDGALVKLPGYVQSASSSRTGLVPALTISGEPRYVKRANQLGAVSRGTLWSKLDQWTPQGHVSPWVCDQSTVIETESPRRNDCCMAGSWSFSVFEVLVGSLLQLRVAARQEGASGETVMLTAAISDASFNCFYPRICQWASDDGAALLAYVRNGSIRFRRILVDSTGVSITSELGTTTGVTSAATPLYDLFKEPGQSMFALAIVSGGGGDVILARGTLVSGGTTLSGYTTQTVAVAPANPTAVAVWFDSTSDLITYAYAHHVAAAPFRHRIRSGVRQFTSFGTVSVAELTVWSRTADSAVPAAQADSVRLLSLVGFGPPGGISGWYYTFFDANPPTPLYGGEFATGYVPTQRGVFVTTAGAVAAAPEFCGWVRMRSKPFYDDSRVFFLAELLLPSGLTTENDANRAYVLLGARADTTGGKRFVPYGFWAYIQAPRADYYTADDTADLTRMSSPFLDGNGNWHLQGFEADAGTLRSRIRDYSLVKDDRLASFAELGQQTYITGALLSAWDGLRCLEAGVLRAPILSTVVQVAGALSAGTRYYKVTFARVSASGELLRGFPSPAKVATNTGAQRNSLQWTPLCVTATSDSDSLPWFVEIWRTKAGETVPFYLVTRIALSPNQRDYMAFIDDVADATLSGTSLGPTELAMNGSAGAELGNDPPIAPVHICEWRNRIWLTDGEQITYSKEGVSNRAAEFSGLFTLARALPQRLTAVKPLGDVLAAFTEDLTAYVYGEGPAGNGEGASLTGPIAIQGDLGCTQPSGLVVVPSGLLVPTRRGIQRLDVKRSYSFVGEAIEDTLETYPRIRDADYQLGDDLVWFAITNAAGSSGEFALLNLRTGAWSTAFPSVSSTTSPCAVRHVGGAQFWAGTGSSTAHYVRDTSLYTLNGSAYAQQVYLPWYKGAGMVGEMRVRRLWLLGQRSDLALPPTSLTVSLWYNFTAVGSPDSTVTFTNADLGGLDLGSSRTLLRMAPPRQRCTSLLIGLAEVASGNSAGFRFVAMRIETAQRRPRGAIVKPAPAGFT